MDSEGSSHPSCAQVAGPNLHTTTLALDLKPATALKPRFAGTPGPDLASPHRVLESSWHLEVATDPTATSYDHTRLDAPLGSELAAGAGVL